MASEQSRTEQPVLPKQRHLPSPRLRVQVDWRAVIAESIFISASILLAFALQDWDEAQDIEERTLIALCNVKAELEFNRVLLEKDFLPRQQGMLSIAQASLMLRQGDEKAESSKVEIRRLMVQESLRRSAWTLAGESGYLLHANFQLATEIGALLDYQEDRYRAITALVYDAVYEHDRTGEQSPVDYYVSVADLVGEWVSQTRYLQRKYEELFAREDFAALECQP